MALVLEKANFPNYSVNRIKNRVNKYKRYDIWMAEMRDGKGSEQVGVRPVLIIQNNKGNIHAPTVIAAPLTSASNKTKLPTHVIIPAKTSGLEHDSTVLFEQIITLDKSRLKYKIGSLDERETRNVDIALAISVGLPIAQ